MLASIRLPVGMIEQIDSLADLQGVRRSDLIRAALADYIGERTSPVGRDEAEHALDVLRRVVSNRPDPRADAA
nr:ribbon-helix-helix domain-containing protein [Micromonospora sp. DSM 115978]